MVYVEGIRNVPLLVAHLLFWYFGAPELLPDALKERLYAGNFEFVAGAIALTLYTAAYMSEDIRSGIRADARPCSSRLDARWGFGFLATMRRIILPQALRITVPPLISQTLNLWKDTSIATVIGVVEMMYQAAQRRVGQELPKRRGLRVRDRGLPRRLADASPRLAAWYQRRWPVRTL